MADFGARVSKPYMPKKSAGVWVKRTVVSSCGIRPKKFTAAARKLYDIIHEVLSSSSPPVRPDHNFLIRSTDSLSDAVAIVKATSTMFYASSKAAETAIQTKRAAKRAAFDAGMKDTEPRNDNEEVGARVRRGGGKSLYRICKAP